MKINEIESSLDDIITDYDNNIKSNDNNKEEIYDDSEEEEMENPEEEIELKEENEESFEENDEFTDNVNNNKGDIFIDENNKININLDIKFEENILSTKIEKIVSDFFLKDFVDIFNKDNKIDSYRQKYEYLIDNKEKEYLKIMKDYRREIYQKEIIERREKILEKFKEEKKKRGKKRKKRKNDFVKIKIIEKNKLENESKLQKYSGNENFFISQKNLNGELLDYAVLYGKKTEKIFIGFQMKCYSSDTLIDRKFIEKESIKKILSPILINSIKYFNCAIKEWHYILIFYYNKNEDIAANLGYRNQLRICDKNVEYLLYDPSQKVFYSNVETKVIQKLELTYISNLDNIMYLNKCSNYLGLPPNFNDELDSDKFDENFGKGINQFVNDFKKYSPDPKNILKELSAKLGLNNLYYCLSFHFPRIEYPLYNQLLFYKKKNSLDFIAIFYDKSLKIIDLEFEEELEFLKCRNLIDIEYEYTYVLRFYNETRKRKDSDNIVIQDYLKKKEKI